MDRELQILSLIEENGQITQRELSKETGLALGTINNALQKLIYEGFINVVQENPRSINYLITIKGKVYKAKCYSNLIETSYDIITSFKSDIKECINTLIIEGKNNILLYGEQNNIFRLVKMNLIEASRVHKIDYKVINELPKHIDSNTIVLIWHAQMDKKVIKKEGIYNILLDWDRHQKNRVTSAL
ncbi:winged helix-turn-helix DNA-binding protein [Natranaerovirga pectinivora]|uniref:Winged helix-turn-helix DNA-binding protein n=1 Tax=Natranaerovirga pectinivora TaxID=682400 RepID=A0A4R3MPD8_9FIRM|nr:winged helix-turn-helix transcriptional regulator [Natranaerovirga pectinivora]TCT17091.1 winged helix-turn-helix DNA-binding protein [Natranaerovirga pectinivora]